MNDMKTVWCFDFDGIIVDIETRYTHIYQDLMNEYGVVPVDEYWQKRRSGCSEKDILAMSEFPMTKLYEYDQRRLFLLESQQYLQLDHLFGSVTNLFLQLSSQNVDSWIVTHRSNVVFFVAELDRLDIKHLVSGWECTKKENSAGLAMLNDALSAQQSKAQFFESLKRAANVVAIGDTVSDILAAKTAGVISIGIASGLQNYEILAKEKPDYLFYSIEELLEKTVGDRSFPGPNS